MIHQTHHLRTYFNVDEFNEHFDANTFNGFNTLHVNISPLSYNTDQLSTQLKSKSKSKI